MKILDFITLYIPLKIYSVWAIIVDYYRYIIEEIRNEGKDRAAFDTGELARIPVSDTLKEVKLKHKTYANRITRRES